MPRLRLLCATVSLLLAGAVLTGCPDGRSPSPPPRVPKPKVQALAPAPLQAGAGGHSLAQGRPTPQPHALRGASGVPGGAFAQIPHLGLQALQDLGLAPHHRAQVCGQVCLQGLAVA